jgi:hypothetical protein
MLKKLKNLGLLLPRPPKRVLVGSGEDSQPGDTLVYTGFDDPNWL